MILKIIFSAIFTLHVTYGCANYPQITCLQELEEELGRSDEQTLIVLDVDEVLITTEDHFIHPYADEAFLPLVQKALAKAVSKEDKRDVEEKLSLSMLLPTRVLVEEGAPIFIRNLQKRGFKVIALTSCPTGAFGIIPKVERWRIDHLRSLNISFASSFPKIERCSFNELASKGKPAPLFEQGILFSKGHKKGEVLKAFLRQSDFHPSKIIVIDDLIANLDSVKIALQPLNIEVQVYQYLGAQRFFKALDEEVLNYQFSHLMQTREWLSDTEIRKLLDRQTSEQGIIKN